VSEREPSGYGGFVVGLAVGAVLGLLFAPEAGRESRGKLGRRLRALRGLASEAAGEVGELVSEAGFGEAGGSRRRAARPRPAGEEDEPLV